MAIFSKLIQIFKPNNERVTNTITMNIGNKNNKENGKTGVVWLIDAAYVLKGHQGKIDYVSIRRELQKWAIPNYGRFDRMIFYNSYDPKNGSDEFIKIMESNGFEMKMYPLKFMNINCDKCGYKGKRMVQKGVDVAIVTDLLSLAYEGQYKRIVITAGDGDFLDAVLKVQSMFREVFVAGYRCSMSRDLKEHADGMYYIQ